jgi:hypothetical protein
MKFAICCLGTVIVTMTFGVSAHAQNRPWCAYYSGAQFGGASNCGFSTTAVPGDDQRHRWLVPAEYDVRAAGRPAAASARQSVLIRKQDQPR